MNYDSHSVPLSELPEGKLATIVSIRLDPEIIGRFMGMGLFAGSRIRILVRGRTSQKPILLSVGDTRIALGEEYAKRILVEPDCFQTAASSI
ncbi:MAG: FeoA family protein [Planctomycetia bacterium]|nr:FeoA family protein [Planctomycetia bacterium]